MNNHSTTRDQATAARNGEAAPARNTYPEPLAGFVACELGTLLGREGWPDRFRTHLIHVAPDVGSSIVVVVWQASSTPRVLRAAACAGHPT